MGFLETPPQEAVDLATELTERAVQAVEGLYANDPNVPLALSGDIDVVVSGGGNYDAYYMGIAMVLERAKTRPDGSEAFVIHRHAGASAGGMMPFGACGSHE